MRKTISTFYNIIKWLILLLLIVISLVVFILESPATVLNLLKTPLQEQNITYGEMQGGLLSGFTLKDVNYNNQIQAKELALSVDFEALKKRVLVIDNLVLKEAQIEKDFLANLIDSNSSDENKSESNVTLPFDRVLIKNADISLENTGYQNYYINSAKLHLSDVKTDMKKEHSGRLTFLLDSNMSQADIKASFKNETYDMWAEIEGNREFIAPFVKEYNLTLLVNPKLTLKAKGDLDAVNYEINIQKLSLKQNDYLLKSKRFRTKGKFNIKKNSIHNNLNTELDGNVAYVKLDALTRLDLDDINRTLLFDIDGKVEPKKTFIPAELAEQNITIQRLPHITLLAKGDMKNVRFKTTIKGLKVKQNKLSLDLKDLELKGSAKPLKGDVKTMLLTHFNSSIVDGKIALKSSVNIKDVNNSLLFDLDSNLNTHGAYLNSFLKDTNVTVIGKSNISLSAKGNMQKIEFRTDVNKFRAKQNEIELNVNNLLLKGETEPIKGNINVNLITKLKSTVADGKINAETKLNFHDVNNSLKFKTKLDFMVHEAYVNNSLKEANVTLRGETPLKLTASGNLETMQVKLDASSKIFAQNILSDVSLKSSEVYIDLKQHNIKGNLKLNSTAKNIALTLNSNFSGDYSLPKKMMTKSQIKITHFNAFGVNLNPLTPLNLNLDKSKDKAIVNLESKLINFSAKSSDLEHIVFDIKTDKIYPSTIVDVPDELNDKFIKLDLAGEATLSKEYLVLKGFLESNKKFKAFVDVKNREEGLSLDIHTKELKINAKGNIKEKNIDATVTIDSLQKIQEEFVRLYPFTLIAINGAVELKAKLRGEEIFATLRSQKIKLDGFNVEDIDIDAEYKKELITLNKLNLKTTGFQDNKLNRKFYLNKKGTIYLGEKRDVSLDIHPNILVDLKGTKENLKGFFSIEALPLGHPKYGEVILTTRINYEQKGKKKKILGSVLLKKMTILYESKFLDPAHDSDVIIITKKDKNKREDGNNFVEDTYIDVSIYAPNGRYKTKDIDLNFKVDIKAKKEFGKNLGMLGKVDEINGMVEQAPKFFSIIDSSIVFRGTKEINPLLDIEVQYELPDVLITIDIYGDANRPKLEFSSDPQMPKKDILSYLLLGVSTAALSENSGNIGREAQLFIMNQAARDLAYELDLDRVFIKDDGTGEGYAVQVGKKIDKKSMFVIESSTEGNSFILEYDVSKNIKVELGQHQKTVPSQSIDIFFRKKFK